MIPDARGHFPPIDPSARNGLIKARLPCLPTSVWETNPNDRHEVRFKAYVGDTGQLRSQGSHFADSKNTASVFSPTLAEQIVLAYSQPGGLILDPFAGGGTRAIIAALHGRRYVGLDIRNDEVDRVNARLRDLGHDHLAQVIHADATAFDWTKEVGAGAAALVMTCPPYWHLERYSNDPGDLSTAPTYEGFLAGLRAAAAALAPALAPGALSAWVLGRMVHPKTKELLDLPGHTERVHRDLGHKAHDRVIVHVRAQQASRVGSFDNTRRTIRCHEEVVVTLAPSVPKTAGPAPVFAEPRRTAEPIANDLTPIERHGEFWLKRDDLYEFAGVRGGKVRACLALARRALALGYPGLVTAGSRSSPQVNIVAHIAREFGLGCRAHIPWAIHKPLGPEVLAAREAGAEVIQHEPGHNSVIIRRAKDDALALGWFEIPFGMECEEAVALTAAQVPDRFPDGVQRIVIPVGSAMSLAGLLHGLRARNTEIPVLGVRVGSDPKKRLAEWAPGFLGQDVELIDAVVKYDKHVIAEVGGVPLDSIYEAKCATSLRPGDLLWIVGRGQTN